MSTPLTEPMATIANRLVKMRRQSGRFAPQEQQQVRASMMNQWPIWHQADIGAFTAELGRGGFTEQETSLVSVWHAQRLAGEKLSLHNNYYAQHTFPVSPPHVPGGEDSARPSHDRT